jgi:hypothetical protein
MHLDLSDEETLALLNLLVETIENDRYPMSPRIRLLQAILAKCGAVGGISPQLAARLRRHLRHPRSAIPRGGHVQGRRIR